MGEYHYLFLQGSSFLHFFSSLSVETENLVNNSQKVFLTPHLWGCDIFEVKERQTNARAQDNKETAINIEEQEIITFLLVCCKLFTIDKACLLRLAYSARQQTYNLFFLAWLFWVPINTIFFHTYCFKEEWGKVPVKEELQKHEFFVWESAGTECTWNALLGTWFLASLTHKMP